MFHHRFAGPSFRKPTDWSALFKETKKKESSLSSKGMQAAQERQKSYAHRKRKPMEFEVGDRVMLKVLPWKGVVGFEFTNFHVSNLKKCYTDEPLVKPV
ncbi:hypothetical protein Tco_0718012 [Tanacetum coccineum]